MKLNWANKIYILMSCSLLGFSIFNILNNRSWDRYYYAAYAFAPASYPVSIRECYFLTADVDEDVYVRTEMVNNQTSSWTNGRDFPELRDKRFLPEKLFISYFSYRTNKFYKGSFQLPTKKIAQLFKQAIKNKSTEKYYSYKDQLKGLSFVVGVANNGQVLVWMRGIFMEELLLRVKLKPSEPVAEDMFYDIPLTKAAYFDQAFENISDSLKLLYRQGFDSPANYADSSTRYLENNQELWEYQQKKGIIDFGK